MIKTSGVNATSDAEGIVLLCEQILLLVLAIVELCAAFAPAFATLGLRTGYKGSLTSERPHKVWVHPIVSKYTSLSNEYCTGLVPHTSIFSQLCAEIKERAKSLKNPSRTRRLRLRR
jgi:hypothetical protein